MWKLSRAIEVVTPDLALLQRHCEYSISERFDGATSGSTSWHSLEQSLTGFSVPAEASNQCQCFAYLIDITRQRYLRGLVPMQDRTFAEIQVFDNDVTAVDV